MDRKIGLIGIIINIVSVLTFAVAMLIPNNNLGYFSSIFIALSFIMMMCSLAKYKRNDSKVTSHIGIVFSAVYTTIILLVYFAQLTTVRFGNLTNQADILINYQNYNLYFCYDLLGYGMMALATFFIGLSIKADTKCEKALRWLLIIHGVFFPACLVVPMLGVFNTTDASSSALTGTILLEFWCVYFIIVGVLSFLYIKNKKEEQI